MDTEDLSERAYQGIILEADSFNHCLALWFGQLSGSCKDENDFIKKSIQLINNMKKYDNEDIESIFFEDIPDINDFHVVLNKILENIVKLKDFTKE